MILKNKIRRIIKKVYYWIFMESFQKGLLMVRGNQGSGEIELFDNTFSYHHGPAFYDTFREIFVQNIYKFNSEKGKPVIIDCGANMGLSLLYFSREFPNADIIAFEPDEAVLPYLEQNIINYKLDNVRLHKKAVWSSSTTLLFYTDEGMGGRVGTNYSNQIPKKVETIRLRDLLNRKIDFLKIDVEGAEIEVLKDCSDELVNVENLFVEYHSFENKEQELGELLNLLKRNGFRYHLRQSFSRRNPFLDKNLVCEYYDMAINVFAYRNSNLEN